MPVTPIVQTVTIIADGPRRLDPVNYVVKADYLAGAIEVMTVEFGVLLPQINVAIGEINQALEDAANSSDLGEGWATLLAEAVEGVEFSSKENAIGVTVPTGSAKSWAHVLDAEIAGGEYSSKENAIGTTVPTGSAKSWATILGAKVDGVEWSAAEYAHGTQVPTGSSKYWAGESEGYTNTAEQHKNDAAESAATALAAPGTYATSSTSLTIGEGIQSFTIQTGKNLRPSMSVKIGYATTPAKWMHGDLISYDSGTGAIQVDVSNTNLSGTYADWIITISAPVFIATKNYTLLADEAVTVVTGLIDDDVSILPSGYAPLYSLDGGATYQTLPSSGLAITHTGDLDLRGWYSFGGVGDSTAEGILAPDDMTFLGGDRYTADRTMVKRYSGVTGTETASDSHGEGTVRAITTDGTDILAFNATGSMLRYAGGDITLAPTVTTGYPVNIYAVAMSGSNLVFLLSTKELKLMVGVTTTVDDTYTPGFVTVTFTSTIEIDSASGALIASLGNVGNSPIIIYSDVTCATELLNINARGGMFNPSGLGTPTPYAIAKDSVTDEFYMIISDFADGGTTNLHPLDQPAGAIVFGAN